VFQLYILISLSLYRYQRRKNF